MNRIRHFFALAFATAAFAGQAQAQAPAQPPTFAGARVEAILGTDSRIFYGGAVGYDLQRGKAVFGVDGELDLSTDRRCQTLNPAINDRLCIRSRRDIYLGGRVGIAVAPSTLLYAKLGYTHLRQRVTYDGGTSGGGFRYLDKFDGVRIGAGLEQKLGANLYVKAEYRYSNYDRANWKHDGALGIGFRF